MQYDSGIPNPFTLARRVENSCELLAPPIPPEISSSNITIVSLTTEALSGISRGSARYIVEVEFRLLFKQPPNREDAMGFELWLDEIQAPASDQCTASVNLPQRSGSIENIIEVDQSEDIFNVFFQVGKELFLLSCQPK